MTQQSTQPATPGWRDQLHQMPERAGNRVKANTDTYYILYYAETSPTGVMGTMKRARYATAHEAADRAHEMRRSGLLRPVEIRDQQDQLVTCELMGWKLPALARPASPPPMDTQQRRTA
ncbi:MAG: hypothetical protein DI549_14510 [Ancylobacter novellus]|uniref:Uncharacterized protein n=1 Tax=Ancylobacter novellus TaxID=921 RepID=A0A2W5QW88_ANCNO|nr:MAG: hypothetical protein DI549_14510 [Ancylobacter novellus]